MAKHTFQYLNEHANPDGPIEKCDMGVFVRDNIDWLMDNLDDLRDLLNLKPGESYISGGGASQGFQIRRVE